MSKYNRIPNPKYAVTDKPEIPICSVNTVGVDGKAGYVLGREYMIARNGTEVTRPFLEHDERRIYFSEKTFHEAIEEIWQHSGKKQ